MRHLGLVEPGQVCPTEPCVFQGMRCVPDMLVPDDCIKWVSRALSQFVGAPNTEANRRQIAKAIGDKLLRHNAGEAEEDDMGESKDLTVKECVHARECVDEVVSEAASKYPKAQARRIVLGAVPFVALRLYCAVQSCFRWQGMEVRLSGVGSDRLIRVESSRDKSEDFDGAEHRTVAQEMRYTEMRYTEIIAEPPSTIKPGDSPEKVRGADSLVRVHRDIAKMPNPTEAMLDGGKSVEGKMFEAVYGAIRTWDVGAPAYYDGHTGATGSHAAIIVDAVRPLIAQGQRNAERYAALEAQNQKLEEALGKSQKLAAERGVKVEDLHRRLGERVDADGFVFPKR